MQSKHPTKKAPTVAATPVAMGEPNRLSLRQARTERRMASGPAKRIKTMPRNNPVAASPTAALSSRDRPADRRRRWFTFSKKATLPKTPTIHTPARIAFLEPSPRTYPTNAPRGTRRTAVSPIQPAQIRHPYGGQPIWPTAVELEVIREFYASRAQATSASHGRSSPSPAQELGQRIGRVLLPLTGDEHERSVSWNRSCRIASRRREVGFVVSLRR
jgi:hypothetical protein